MLMTQASYAIHTDAARMFVHLTLVGDWNLDLTARFAEELQLAWRAMVARGAVPGRFVTLVDMRRKNILPQNVAAEFAKLVHPDSPSRRIALLVSGHIHRLQAKRIGDDRRRVFEAPEPAMAWLFDGDPAGPPALPVDPAGTATSPAPRLPG